MAYVVRFSYEKTANILNEKLGRVLKESEAESIHSLQDLTSGHLTEAEKLCKFSRIYPRCYFQFILASNLQHYATRIIQEVVLPKKPYESWLEEEENRKKQYG